MWKCSKLGGGGVGDGFWWAFLGAEELVPQRTVAPTISVQLAEY